MYVVIFVGESTKNKLIELCPKCSDKINSSRDFEGWMLFIYSDEKLLN